MLEPTPEHLTDFEPIAEQIKGYWKKWGWAMTAGHIGSVLLMLEVGEEVNQVRGERDGPR